MCWAIKVGGISLLLDLRLYLWVGCVEYRTAFDRFDKVCNLSVDVWSKIGYISSGCTLGDAAISSSSNGITVGEESICDWMVVSLVILGTLGGSDMWSLSMIGSGSVSILCSCFANFNRAFRVGSPASKVGTFLDGFWVRIVIMSVAAWMRKSFSVILGNCIWWGKNSTVSVHRVSLVHGK